MMIHTNWFMPMGARECNELLEVREITSNTTPVMVPNYNPSNPKIKEIIHKIWNIISNSPDCGPIFNEKPIIGFRPLPNLYYILTSSTTMYPLQTGTTQDTYVPICTRLGKCTYCSLIKKMTDIE